MMDVNLIIAGGREFDHYPTLESICNHALTSFKDGVTISVVSGGARGADALGEQWAKQYGLPLILMRADWNQYGKRAGILRNIEMAKIATHCICFWDGKSHGTSHMIKTAQKYGLKLYIHQYE